MARLADSVHTKLQPTPSERMLIFPPVAKAQILLGARWAPATPYDWLPPSGTTAWADEDGLAALFAMRTALTRGVGDGI